MAEMINGVRVPFIPISRSKQEQKDFLKSSRNEFDSIFQEELLKLKLYSHAEKRLESRNIHLSSSDMNRLNEAVERASGKGANDSLIMMDDNAFVVNVNNRTVVTAVQLNEANKKVFTNIDS